MLEHVEAMAGTKRGKTRSVLRELRDALGWKQRHVVARTGAADGSYYSRLERGDLAASTTNARATIARAFDLTRDEVDDLLSGALSVDAVAALVRTRVPDPDVTGPQLAAALPPRASEDRPTDVVARLKAAVARAFAADRHTLDDANAVVAALPRAAGVLAAANDPVPIARRALDAAAKLRSEGQPVTIATLYVQLALSTAVLDDATRVAHAALPSKTHR